MVSSGNGRRNLLTAGGVLSTVGGIPQVISGGVLVLGSLVSYGHRFLLISRFFLPFFPDAWRHYVLWGSGPIPADMDYIPVHWPILGAFFVALGIVAIVGGVSAVRGRRFGLSLAGAICALPSVFLGILAVILVALGKREFRVKGKEMPSNGSDRKGLLTAGGVLSTVGGIPQVISGGVLVFDSLVSYRHGWRLINSLFLQFFPDGWRFYVLSGGTPIPASMDYVPVHWPILGAFFVALGIVAVVGGISAVRRKRFGLSLDGAICALPSVFLGILAVIFVALGKREFGAKA